MKCEEEPKMKKLWCALLIAALVLGAAGCAAKEPAAEADAAESEGGTLEILCLINNLADNNSLNYANAIGGTRRGTGGSGQHHGG